MTHTTDINLTPKNLQGLTSADALAGFLTELGYDTGRRKALTPEAIGLAGESAAPIRAIEILAEDAEGFLRVVFVHLKSLTARSRNDLARVLGRTNVDHLLVLASDFDVLEFVLLHKRRRETHGPGDAQRIQVVPLSLAVPRKAPGTRLLRAVRRFTWTGRDGLEQFDKLRAVFEAAAFSEDYFCNRALFADHYLLTRLREDSAWRDNPSDAFQRVKSLLRDARGRWLGKGEQVVRQQLYEPLFDLLGFRATAHKAAGDGQTKPDYLLECPAGRTAAFVYAWDRWLDGPDFNLDPDTPEENPGACVVTALEEGTADWIIMTNGRQWRLYSRHAHSRATNFYEVDLVEALIASGGTDPNEAFRYWWLFFREQAFAPIAPTTPEGAKRCWLDTVAEGSRDYAREVEGQLKKRVFYDVVPMLAAGFLDDRRTRLGKRAAPDDAELESIRAGTLALLYRLLFLLYAESRDLLPVREAPYYSLSLKKLKQEIAQAAGGAPTNADDLLRDKFTTRSIDLYDRLADPGAGLFAAMAEGRASANVPKYNGGLFRLDPAEASDEREASIIRFLNEHKVPDQYLAIALDRLARVMDEKTTSLVFVDFKSLGVRQLGSLYEGLLEFRLALADEDLAVKEGKTLGEYIPLAKARGRAARKLVKQVLKGEPILRRDNTERKATGAYYTPDHIVQYIVENTVGPVLKRKLEDLRPEFRKAEQTHHTTLANAKADPRIMLAWRPESGGALEGPTGRPTDRDIRRFALEKTYDQHKALVERLFDCKVLDPAMGSGHFLVEAVDFITDELLDFLNAFPVNPVAAAIQRTRDAILDSLKQQGIETDETLRRQLTDVHLLKRHVLKRCIYGVDLNPLATELAKVSLWLDAFTLGAPLSFLDHHLRTGNSLIGASLPQLEDATQGELWAIPIEPIYRAVRNVLAVASRADSTAQEVTDSKRLHDEMRRWLSGYAILLDILTAKHFGVDAMTILQHGSGLKLESREMFQRSLDRVDRAMVEKVEAIAAERRFFHWDLEFPEVFYGLAGIGEGRVERRPEGDAGFDAIVGNPPFVDKKAIVNTLAAEDVYWQTCRSFATATGIYDLYMLFVESSLGRIVVQGRIGLVTPIPWLTQSEGSRLRAVVLRHGDIQVRDFSGEQHFDSALVKVVAVLASNSPAGGTVTIHNGQRHVQIDRVIIDSVFGGQVRLDARLNDIAVLQKLQRRATALQSLCTVTFGLRALSKERGAFEKNHLIRSQAECANPVRYIEADDLVDDAVCWRGRWLDYQPEIMYSPRDPTLFEQPKILVPSLLSDRRVRAAYDREGYFADQSLVCVTYWRIAADDARARPSLEALAAQLRSATVSWYFAHAIVGEALGGGAIHATPGLVGQLPVFRDVLAEDGVQDYDALIWSLCELTAVEQARIRNWWLDMQRP